MPLFRVQSQSLRAREIQRGGEGGRQLKNEAISEGVRVAFRGVFREALCKIGEFLKSNSCSVEQAVSYFRRSLITIIAQANRSRWCFGRSASVPESLETFQSSFASSKGK